MIDIFLQMNFDLNYIKQWREINHRNNQCYIIMDIY